MESTVIATLVNQVDQQRLRHDFFYLAKDPLPYRKLNYTLEGHKKNTLYEADDYIQRVLESFGYQVEKEPVQVQAFRCDDAKPRAHRYSPPAPEDPWYTAYNLNARKRGIERPDETIVIVAHKDSQSWVDSPGALDNAVGTVGAMEIARILSGAELARSVWFLFCNEEHTPWTSEVAAQNAKARGDKIVAVFNLDGLAGRSEADAKADRKTNVTVYTVQEGRKLADLMAEVNGRYSIGLIQSEYQREFANDDDGSFVKAGFPAAVLNIGSFPYADPNYHIEDDRPEHVDTENLRMSVQATLAAVLELCRSGLKG